jgi:signal transduction histidine kinase
MNVRMQAYMLIAVPMLAGLVFMFSLMASLAKLDHAVEAELHARDVMQRVSDLDSRLWAMFSDIKQSHFVLNQRSFRKYVDQTQWFGANCEALKELVRNDTNTKSEVDAYIADINGFRGHADKILALLSKSAGGSEGPVILEKIGLAGPILAKSESVLANLQVHRHEIDTSYAQVIAEFQPKAVRERHRLLTLVIFGACVNIAIAIILAAQFGKRIVMRLDRLMDNIQKFANRKTSLDEIEGRDEIAVVSRAFREVAEARIKSEEFKALVLSMVSHDLRSPLLSVSGFLTMTLDGNYGALTPQLDYLFKSANSDILMLFRTANDLLDIEKLDNNLINLTTSNEFVESLVQRSFDEMKDIVEALGVRLTMSISTELTVECDSIRITQVLVRLLTNAVKCSPSDSVVSVSAFKTANGIRIEVMDYGPVITKDEQLHAFDQFLFENRSSQQKRQIGGITLFLCKALVEAHGGAIGTNSDPVTGDCFWLELPNKVKIQ